MTATIAALLLAVAAAATAPGSTPRGHAAPTARATVAAPACRPCHGASGQAPGAAAR